MNPCQRGAVPELLVRYGHLIGKDYATKRRADAAYRFQWPKREGQWLYAIAYTALGAVTDQHCAYCDGYPIDATGEEQIDHFRPKSRPEFYELVCTWDNLFLICSACNKA